MFFDNEGSGKTEAGDRNRQILRPNFRAGAKSGNKTAPATSGKSVLERMKISHDIIRDAKETKKPKKVVSASKELQSRLKLLPKIDPATVMAFTPPELTQTTKIIIPTTTTTEQPASPLAEEATGRALVKVKENLETLQTLESRIRFMLKELEEMIKE